MDRSDVIKLIAKSSTKDAAGIHHDIEVSKEVFCNTESIGSAEFFRAGANGLRAEFRFTIFAYDYSGETTVEYDGIRYSIYRTYKAKKDELELYVTKEVGS